MPGQMILVGALLVALPVAVPAGEGVEKVESSGMEGVEEAAFLSEREPGMSPAAVTVFDREDIETTGASTVPDLLRLVPGMDVVVATPFYQSVSSRLPWTDEGNRFLVLVDGQAVNLEFAGLVPWGLLPLSLDDVERIEVVRGPMSSQYGAGALAGVIRITTRIRPAGSSGWVGLAGGELNSLGGGARASFTTGGARVSFFGAGGTMGTFGDPQVEGRRVVKLHAAADLPLSESSRLFFDGGYAEGTGDFFSGEAPYRGGRVILGTFRLGYESESIRGQLAFNLTPLDLKTIPETSPMDYAGIRLANFHMPETMEVSAYSLGVDLAWKAPELAEMVRFLVGGQVRTFWLDMYCTHCLNPDTYADITSPRYHVPGLDIDHDAVRLGTFVGVELAPAEWLTASASARFDFDSETDPFASVRLAVVARPLAGQFFRLGLGRSYRRTPYLETGGQPTFLAEFPAESPITGPARDRFQEFLTRVELRHSMGNDDLFALEMGYLGRFLDGRLSVGLDAYLSMYSWKKWVSDPNIVPDAQGLPDLDQSSFRSLTRSQDVEVFGAEVSLRFDPVKGVSLLAWWAHREVSGSPDLNEPDVTSSPTDMFALGGHYLSSFGLLGSAHMFYRTGFSRRLETSGGILEPAYIVSSDMDDEILILGRLGWRLELWAGFDLEAGVKVFLPVSPSSAPHHRYRESMGGWNQYSQNYTGEELGRVVLGYMQGIF